MLFIIWMSLTSCLARQHIPRHMDKSPLWIELNRPFLNQTIEGDMIFGTNLNNSIGVRYLPKGLAKL